MRPVSAQSWVRVGPQCDQMWPSSGLHRDQYLVYARMRDDSMLRQHLLGRGVHSEHSEWEREVQSYG